MAGLCCNSALAAIPLPVHSVTLAWNASPSSTIAGYHLYYGGASQAYTNTIDAGASTLLTVSNLAPQATYFFAVTSYDVLGLESAFSSEISYTVPGSAILQLSGSVASGLQLTGSAPVGYQYQVLRTADLKSWTAVGTITVGSSGTFQFTDVPSTNANAQCYRLLQTYP